MALQTSGAISLSDVATEFSASAPYGLKSFYRGGSLVPDTAANASVPTSGAIKLKDFYGASSFSLSVSSISLSPNKVRVKGPSTTWGTTTISVTATLSAVNNSGSTLNYDVTVDGVDQSQDISIANNASSGSVNIDVSVDENTAADVFSIGVSGETPTADLTYYSCKYRYEYEYDETYTGVIGYLWTGTFNYRNANSCRNSSCDCQTYNYCQNSACGQTTTCTQFGVQSNQAAAAGFPGCQNFTLAQCQAAGFTDCQTCCLASSTTTNSCRTSGCGCQTYAICQSGSNCGWGSTISSTAYTNSGPYQTEQESVEGNNLGQFWNSGCRSSSPGSCNQDTAVQQYWNVGATQGAAQYGTSTRTVTGETGDGVDGGNTEYITTVEGVPIIQDIQAKSNYVANSFALTAGVASSSNDGACPTNGVSNGVLQ